MVSPKHRLLEFLVRHNSPDLKVVDPEEFRALRIRRQNEVPTGPPDGLEDRVALSSWDQDGMQG